MPTSRLTRAVARALALAILLGVPAVAVFALAVPAAADVGIGIGPAPVHPDTAVIISGSKDADARLDVSIRPPGNTWLNEDASCSGLAVGSTSWSCRVAPGAGWAHGDHEVRAQQSGGTSDAIATGRFVVVPTAVKGPNPAPTPPLPGPTATPTPTPTPTVPAVTPPATAPPASAPPASPPAAHPVTTSKSGKAAPDVQLATLALPATSDPAPEPAGSAPHARKATTPPPASRNEPSTPSALSHGLPTLEDILAAPASFAEAGGFGALLLLLIAIPAHLLDDTIEANSHRIAGWFRRFAPLTGRVRRWRAALPKLPFSGPVVIILASVAFGFADPQFGFDLVSLRTTLALATGLLLVMEVPNLVASTVLTRRWSARARVVTQPGALVLSLIGVVASRIFGFHPGLLIGLVIGLELASDARSEHRRRAVTLRMASTAAVATAAWLVYSLLDAGNPHPTDFAGLLTRESLVAATDEGLTGLVVALLPITFMEGKQLFDGSKRTWAAIALPVGFLFALLVLPRAFTEEGPGASFWVWIAVLVGFSALALGVWLAFRITEKAAIVTPEPEREIVG
ncbi:hypothetical protein ACFPJ4_01085 [Lysinimonas soli]|uniref:Uncharacterized protein n=1 Tax=Lysinimonas soli TaxID=1074233 RepID=A0ABW0NN57_9MICO